MDSDKTATTRYLCAAAYLDSGFRNKVIKEIVENEHRAVGPCYGVDIVMLAKHCLEARRRVRIRDTVLGLMLLASVAVAAASQDVTSFVPSSIIAWIIVFSDRWRSHYGIARRLLRESADSAESSSNYTLRERLDEISKQQDGNVIVYSGFSPFVGSGFDIGGWSFAVDVRKGKDRAGARSDPRPLEVMELYDYLGAALANLNLPGMTIEDKLHVHGKDVRTEPRLLPDPLARPRTQIEPAMVRTFIDNPSQAIRHYRCIRALAWGGELILSVFLRFTKLGQNLFVEASYFLLTPLQEKFHQIDSVSLTPTLRQRLEQVQSSIVTFPFLFAFSPLIVLSNIFRPVRRWLERRRVVRAIRENPAFDYGAEASVREFASSSEYRRYFQKLDREMFMKILEKQILDRIVEFLDQRDIDTSDLRDRQTTILNNGVIVSGGSIRAESLSVGERARAGVFRLVRTAGPGGGTGSPISQGASRM